MPFVYRTTIVCAFVCLLATAARADLYLGRIDIKMADEGPSWWLPYQHRAVPVIGTAPGGNAVGAPLAMGAGDIFVEDRFVMTYPSSSPYVSSSSHASFGNGAGTLAAGAGPGTTTICEKFPFCSIPGNMHAIRVSMRAGGIRFGGIQRMLGRVFLRSAVWAESAPTGSISIMPYDVILTVAGGGVAETATDQTPIRRKPDYAWTSPRTITVTGMPWTTGKVIVATDISYGGTYHQQATATGYDTTVSGFRNIQLVSGLLAHYSLAPNEWVNFAGIAIMNLRFVPEPDATVLLVAGMAALPLLHRVWARKHRRRHES